MRQSPVDVPETEVEQDSSLLPISCNYGDGEYCKMNNTGASWMLNLWPEETWLRGGPLQGEYRGFQVNKVSRNIKYFRNIKVSRNNKVSKNR